MRTTARKKTERISTRSVLRVVKTIRVTDKPATIQKLADTAWNFAYTALWNSTVFSTQEKRAAKAMIEEIISAGKTPLKNYKAFCQRVLLARQYVNANPNRYIPLPTIWLDQENLTGYAGTASWYENIQDIRVSLPNYKTELKAFAEAILEMSEESTAANFQYWRNYFIDNKATGLLGLFLCTIANAAFMRD